MSKMVIVYSIEDLAHKQAILMASADHTKKKISSLLSIADPLAILRELKFNKAGCDPLNPERDLNLIEQLNQTFTYWATFEAANYLFKKHPEVKSLTLHLGTHRGWDIETEDAGGIHAEVFAATSPQSNDKLRKDVEKASGSTAKDKYVFFSCPEYSVGIQNADPRYPNVKIVSVGMYEGSGLNNRRMLGLTL